MNSLTADEYFKLDPNDRAAIDAWCRLHWIHPADTFALRWDGDRVVADQFRKRWGKYYINRHASVATTTRGVPQCAPFPACSTNPSPHHPSVQP